MVLLIVGEYVVALFLKDLCRNVRSFFVFYIYVRAHPRPYRTARSGGPARTKWDIWAGLPILNREVKPVSADGTAYCGRVCRRLVFEKHLSKDRCFFLFIAFYHEPIVGLLPIDSVLTIKKFLSFIFYYLLFL